MPIFAEHISKYLSIGAQYAEDLRNTLSFVEYDNVTSAYIRFNSPFRFAFRPFSLPTAYSG